MEATQPTPSFSLATPRWLEVALTQSREIQGVYILPNVGHEPRVTIAWY